MTLRHAQIGHFVYNRVNHNSGQSQRLAGMALNAMPVLFEQILYMVDANPSR
jgi:hypothetical protein